MPYRGGKERFRRSRQTISDHRVAWTRNHMIQLIVRWFEPESNGDLLDDDGNRLADTQIGANVRIELNPASARSGMAFDLTSMSVEELDAFEKIMSLAIDLAKPVVKERDARAREEDPSTSRNARLYRSLPEVVVREGAFAPHGEGVHDGPSDVPSGDAGADGVDGRDRGTGGGVAHDASRLAVPLVHKAKAD